MAAAFFAVAYSLKAFGRLTDSRHSSKDASFASLAPGSVSRKKTNSN
jgi:hypothetical protein